MKIYQSSRRQGKTTYMLGWLRVHPTGVLVVHSYAEKHRLSKENPELEDRIITVDAMRYGKLRGRRDLIIGIDNLDLILPYLFGGPIGPVTMTEEEEW